MITITYFLAATGRSMHKGLLGVDDDAIDVHVNIISDASNVGKVEMEEEKIEENEEEAEEGI